MRLVYTAPSSGSACPRDRPCAGVTGCPSGRLHPNHFRALPSHRPLEVLVDLVEEASGGKPRLIGADQQREVLGHVTRLHGLHADPLQRLGKAGELIILVQRRAVAEAARRWTKMMRSEEQTSELQSRFGIS